MQNWLLEIWANEVYRNIFFSGVVILLAFILRRILRGIINNRLQIDNSNIFTINKAIDSLLNIISIILILGIWVQQKSDLSVALGIMGAGIAFALQEVIGSIAGWTTIVFGRPYGIGDRIETGSIRGDVVDIGVLRTKLMEIGNWLDGEHNTGRIVTVSNAFIFKEPLFNSSKYLPYIWDEITIPVSYDSDWKTAIQIMLHAVESNPEYQLLLPDAQKQRREARSSFAIKITPLEARTFVKLTDNWIALGLVYPVAIDVRRTFRSEISQIILEEFTSNGIRVASQTIAIVQFPESSANKPV